MASPAGSEASRVFTVPDLISRVPKPLMTLPALSTTVSSASAKSNFSLSPLALRPLVLSSRLRCSPGTASAISAIFRITASLPAPRLPCRVSVVTLGAASVKVSAATVPFSATTSGVLLSLLITLLPMSATVVLAVTPSRVKVAVPSAATLMVMAPEASPEKSTTPLASLTTNSATLLTLIVNALL